MPIRARWIAASLAAALLLILGFFLLTESGRSTGRAALLVAGLLSDDGPTPLSLFTPAPLIEDVLIPTRQAAVPARLFEPRGTGPYGALILVAGYPSNIDDLQLSTVAEDLARLGIVTLIPKLPDLRRGRLSADDVDVLVESFQWLAERPHVAPTSVGYGGFCVGSSLSLLAAQDPRINRDVRLVNAFGGYYNLTSFIRAVATRTSTVQGRKISWQPSPSTLMLVTQNVLELAPEPADGDLLRRIIVDGDPADEILPALSPVGAISYQYLTTSDPQKIDDLLERLPGWYKDHLDALSPSNGMSNLHANIFIMHDHSDPYIPVAESYRLADAITDPEQKKQATFELFAHVRPHTSLDGIILLRDGVKLVGYLNDLLQAIMIDP